MQTISTQSVAGTIFDGKGKDHHGDEGERGRGGGEEEREEGRGARR